MHGGPTVPIQGVFEPEFIHSFNLSGDLARRSLKAADYARLVFTMVALLFAVYGVSNHREVRALWQMQRHALVHYYKADVVPSSFRRKGWLRRAALRLGLLHSPPMVDG